MIKIASDLLLNRDYKSQPIDRVAARVTRPGINFIPQKKVQTRDSDLPLKVMKVLPHNVPDLVGTEFGRFRVIGYSEDFKKSWVVRCSCGVYTTRKTWSIRNPNNSWDRCEQCRHLAFLKREEVYRRTGKDADIVNF